MIIAIFDMNNNPIASQTDVKVLIKRQYIYGLPLEFHVGVRNPSISFDLRKNYKIITEKWGDIKMLMYSSYKEIIGNDIIQFYRFIHPVFESLLDNTLPNEMSLFSISFKEYIKELDNQFDYFVFGLRKKGLFMSLNNKGLPEQKHTFKALFGEVKEIKDEVYAIDLISDFSLKAQNYYTILDTGEVVRTHNGKNIPQYLPFATKEDINGLDTYIIPKYELKAPVSNLNIGDIVKIYNDRCIIMEKEVFRYKTNEQTLLVAGVKV
jgi:hypothetical protein